MKRKWKIILIALLMLPMVVFFPACSCGDSETVNTDPQEYIVRFYTGSSDTFNIPSQTIEEGNLVRRPDNPVKDGFEFIGWYKDASLTRLWSFDVDTVKGNMTLYARWQER